MKKNNNVVRTIAEVGIFAAIGFILDEIQGALAFSFTSGGSIGFAMVAVLIIAYRRGWLPAVVTGLIMGLLDFATKAFIVHPAQIFLDYILPYALVGVAGLFKPLFDKADDKKIKVLWLIVGTVIGGTFKFFSHYFSGLFFWNNPGDFAWNLNYMSPALYSLVYNIAYIGPCIILSGALLVVLFLRAPKVIMTQGEIVKYISTKENKLQFINYLLAITLFISGAFLFIFFLIRYINSYYYDDGWKYFSFDKDSMVIFLFGFGLMVLAINHIIATILKKEKIDMLCLILGILILLFAGYGLSQILDMYIDSDKPINNIYWAWFVPSLVVSAVSIFLFIYIRKNQQKE